MNKQMDYRSQKMFMCKLLQDLFTLMPYENREMEDCSKIDQMFFSNVKDKILHKFLKELVTLTYS